MTPAEFADHFKSLSHAELWEVLQNRNRYQAAALEAAETEWSHRQLDEETIKALTNESIASRQKLKEEGAQKKEAEEQAKKDVLDFFVQEKEEETKTKRVAYATGTILGIFILISLFQYFDTYILMASEFLYEPIDAFFFFLPAIIGVLGCIKLIRLKQSGWYLTMIYVGWILAHQISFLYSFVRFGNPSFAALVIPVLNVAFWSLPEAALIWLRNKAPFVIPKKWLAGMIILQVIFLLYLSLDQVFPGIEAFRLL